MKMRILEEHEKSAYSDFMDKIAMIVMSTSVTKVKELENQHIDAINCAEEIGLVIGQAVLDEIIELTKDMSRDLLLKYIAEIAIGHSIQTLEKYPEYKMRILMLLAASR
jgi:hypothetical protein